MSMPAIRACFVAAMAASFLSLLAAPALRSDPGEAGKPSSQKAAKADPKKGDGKTVAGKEKDGKSEKKDEPAPKKEPSGGEGDGDGTEGGEGESKGGDDEGGTAEEGKQEGSGPKADPELVALEGEIRELQKMSALELDMSSPKFISKDDPPFQVLRPGASLKGGKSKPAPKAKAKNVVPDGSRWGFVDFALRKKRIGTLYDKAISFNEKVAADSNRKEDDRSKAEKLFRRQKAEKNLKLKDMEKARCQIELQGKEKSVWLRITTQDKPVEGGEKQLKDAMRSSLTKEGWKINKEQPETGRGKKLPGHTFFAELDLDRGSPEEGAIWLRQTYFMVPKKKSGLVLFIFTCRAPKDLVNEQLEKDFEAFIQQTQF